MPDFKTDIFIYHESASFFIYIYDKTHDLLIL